MAIFSVERMSSSTSSVTVDKNVRFQSNLRGMDLRVAVLDVKGNDFVQLIGAAQALLPRLESLP